jgi:hypothetical protein
MIGREVARVVRWILIAAAAFALIGAFQGIVLRRLDLGYGTEAGEEAVGSEATQLGLILLGIAALLLLVAAFVWWMFERESEDL